MRMVLVVLAVLSVAGAAIFIAVRTADRDSSASRRTRDTTTSTSAFGAGRASTATISAPSTTHDEWAVAERRYLSEGSMAKLYETRQDERPKEVEGAHSELVV